MTAVTLNCDSSVPCKGWIYININLWTDSRMAAFWLLYICFLSIYINSSFSLSHSSISIIFHQRKKTIISIEEIIVIQRGISIVKKIHYLSASTSSIIVKLKTAWGSCQKSFVRLQWRMNKTCITFGCYSYDRRHIYSLQQQSKIPNKSLMHFLKDTFNEVDHQHWKYPLQ